MTDPEAPDRREFFRIRTLARVGLRPLGGDELEGARLRIAARAQPARFAIGMGGDDLRPPPESYAVLHLLQQILFALERANRRLDDLLAYQVSGSVRSALLGESLMISLSGSGFAGSFAYELRTGERVEVELELPESGLPILPCLARVVHAQKEEGKRTYAALYFEALSPEDRERIVQFCIQTQSRELAARRPETAA